MVTIEELAPGHLEAVAAWLSDSAINKWLSSDWRNKAVTPNLIAIAMRNKRNKFFLVRYAGSPCGLVALSDIDTEDHTAMIWYLLGVRQLAGRGIITAAVRLLVERAFADGTLASVYAWAMEDNPASQKVLKNSGFQNAGRLRKTSNSDGKQVDRLYFDVLPSDRARTESSAVTQNGTV